MRVSAGVLFFDFAEFMAAFARDTKQGTLIVRCFECGFRGELAHGRFVVGQPVPHHLARRARELLLSGCGCVLPNAEIGLEIDRVWLPETVDPGEAWAS